MHQSIRQSIRDCLSSRATSRLIVCKRNVQMIVSGYDFLKSQVLSCWWKVESVCDVVISSGRVFQTWGPATVNARSPTVERLTDGTIRRLVPPERSVRRPGWSATGTSGPRYSGALLCTSAQRPCNRSAPGPAASEGRQERRWCGPRNPYDRSAVLPHSVPTKR